MDHKNVEKRAKIRTEMTLQSAWDIMQLQPATAIKQRTHSVQRIFVTQ